MEKLLKLNPYNFKYEHHPLMPELQSAIEKTQNGFYEKKEMAMRLYADFMGIELNKGTAVDFERITTTVNPDYEEIHHKGIKIFAFEIKYEGWIPYLYISGPDFIINQLEA